MFVFITNDVNTEDRDGRKRLRRVAKLCVDHGVRVQNSVFECLLNAAEWRILQADLLKEIDHDRDSLRFYYLNESQRTRSEHHGAKKTIAVDEPLIF